MLNVQTDKQFQFAMPLTWRVRDLGMMENYCNAREPFCLPQIVDPT